MEDISVVLCAYSEDRWDDICAAIASIQEQTVAPKEIILVIDHNPVLFSRANEFLSGITVLENNQTHGASGSRNTGVRNASGSIVAFLDDDAVASPTWIEKTLAEFSDPLVLGVGGAIDPLWLEGQPWWFPSEFNWVVGCTYTGTPQVPSRIRNLIGANMSVRIAVFNQTGGFRAGFGNIKSRSNSKPFWLQSSAGDEETEFCIKAQTRYPGHYWLYLPAAKVSHKVPGFRCRWKYFLSRCYDEGFGKALLVRTVGSGQGLFSERAYTIKTLPKGVLAGLANTARNKNSQGIARAGAIIVGFSITVLGFIVGSTYIFFNRHGSQS